MGLRYRDLVVDLIAQAPPKPCGCSGTYAAPKCPKGSQNPAPRPKPDGPRPPKQAQGLEQLRHQLRYQLRSELQGVGLR